MLIGEVYTSAKVEYYNGEFVGYAEDGTIAKTLLVFMIRSLHGNYKDVVKMIPVPKLNAEFLFDCTNNMLQKLGTLGLTVLALGADNHAVNR